MSVELYFKRSARALATQPINYSFIALLLEQNRTKSRSTARAVYRWDGVTKLCKLKIVSLDKAYRMAALNWGLSSCPPNWNTSSIGATAEQVPQSRKVTPDCLSSLLLRNRATETARDLVWTAADPFVRKPPKMTGTSTIPANMDRRLSMIKAVLSKLPGWRRESSMSLWPVNREINLRLHRWTQCLNSKHFRAKAGVSSTMKKPPQSFTWSTLNGSHDRAAVPWILIPSNEQSKTCWSAPPVRSRSVINNPRPAPGTKSGLVWVTA